MTKFVPVVGGVSTFHSLESVIFRSRVPSYDVHQWRDSKGFCQWCHSQPTTLTYLKIQLQGCQTHDSTQSSLPNFCAVWSLPSATRPQMAERELTWLPTETRVNCFTTSTGQWPAGDHTRGFDTKSLSYWWSSPTRSDDTWHHCLKLQARVKQFQNHCLKCLWWLRSSRNSVDISL